MEDKIVVTNSAIIINNYDMGDCVKLENCFKVLEPVTKNYYTHYYLGMYYDKNNRKLYLPRGIDIWYVEKLLGVNAKILVNQYDKYHTYEDAMIKYLPRDDAQKEALKFMIGSGKYMNNQYKSQLSVNLSTGKGKTYLSIATLMYLGIRGIVIASTTDWLKQWKERTGEYTDINPKDIYNISGSNNIHRLLRMTDTQLNRYKLFLVTHSTLRSFADSQGWEMIGELFRKLKIGIKIFDEAHLDFSNVCMIDFFTNTYRTYYLTATPMKSNERENQIYKMAFKNVPSIDLFDENVDPHTSYVAIFYNSNPSAQQISSCKNNKYGLDRNKYTDYVVGQDEFYKLLVILIDLTNQLAPNPNDKVLIYIGTNKSIKATCELIKTFYPELDGNIGIYTSIINAKDKREALTKRIILSTTKSAGAAVDIPGLAITINLAEPYKSEVIARQSLGRTRGENTFYIDIVDTGFEQCRRFYYKKLPIFEKYAKDCSVIRLNKTQLDEKFNGIVVARTVKLFTHIENSKPALFTHL